jgi:hypothetical protein
MFHFNLQFQQATKRYQKNGRSSSQSHTSILTSSLPHSIDQKNIRCACATIDRSIHLGHSDRSRTSARESLNSHDLEVEVLVGEAVLGPSVEVSSGVDSARGTLALPDGPVLGEGAGASDGRLVGAGVGALHVGRAVDGDGAELGHAGGAGVEAAVAVEEEMFVRGFVFSLVDVRSILTIRRCSTRPAGC